MKFLCNFILLSLLPILSGCQSLSEHYSNPKMGMNGGFEFSQNGLPVNWIIFSQKTVPNADFKIIIDQENVKEGNQSLKFDVKHCEAKEGWQSPGFSNEFIELGHFREEGVYKMSFWIMNRSSRFKISAGSVDSKNGDLKTLIDENKDYHTWSYKEYTIDVTKNRWLRVQLNILEPGQFWIDDFKMSKIK